MFKTKPFYCSDLFKLDLTNLDSATENYSIEYYLINLLDNSQDCYLVENNNLVYGYLIGKLECKEDILNTHVTALSISPQVRRNKIASFLMDTLRNNAINDQSKYIDLFVRVSNKKAIDFYMRKG
ncbi:N-terminal acyltransferase complex (ARD) subunit [Tubulinosema ratisbonensis]|uniref:N-terminal acyltransferase complex (ARD) subunit n=1 Tax=Tubulinosema ratisbonensis TaxID=291195 RepID=A0A437AHG4_9MICR|nr:N-terminal acyltransferase complex (ARD) subunit [Tubulinosema ratisbonensis]